MIKLSRVLYLVILIVMALFLSQFRNVEDKDNSSPQRPEYGTIGFLGNVDCQRMFNPDIIVATFEQGEFGINLSEGTIQPINICSDIGKPNNVEIQRVYSSSNGQFVVFEVIDVDQFGGPAYNQLLRWHESRAGELELAYFSPDNFPFRDVIVTNEGSIYYSFGIDPFPRSLPITFDDGSQVAISDSYVLTLTKDEQQLITLDGARWFAVLRNQKKSF